MNTLPVDRALSIYETLADRSATKGTRERLSKHLMKIYLEGKKDPHRLTVHGLSYLRNFDRILTREIEWPARQSKLAIACRKEKRVFISGSR